MSDDERMTLDSLRDAADEARAEPYAPEAPQILVRGGLLQENTGYGPCPECSEIHEETSRERRPNGNTTCGACSKTTPSSRWKA